jgi:hypothetical protein
MYSLHLYNQNLAWFSIVVGFSDLALYYNKDKNNIISTAHVLASFVLKAAFLPTNASIGCQ